MKLIWKVGHRQYPPLISKNQNLHPNKVKFGYKLGLQGTMTLDEDRERFPSRNTTFELKSTETDELIGMFNLDLGEVANQMEAD